MKFIVCKQDLVELIRKIQNIVPLNATIPILSHFLIEAKGDELVLTATDLTVGARAYLPAKVKESGAISLPSRRFFQLLKELTDTNLEVTASPGEMAQIQAGSSSFHLHGMDKSEYPTLPDMAHATQFKIGGDVLKEMLFRTSFAVSKEESRYCLTGVLMRIKEGKAIFVGTDGKRLAKAETPVPLLSDFSGDYILPLKAVDEIVKGIDDNTEATIYLSEDKVAVESGNSLLVSKLLSGDYPDYEQIIRAEAKTSLPLHREELITLLRQISLFVSESAHSVRFTFVPGELILTANSAEFGNGTVSMPINFQGEKLEIAFNPHFFLDILRHSKDEIVMLGVSDPYNPGLITDSSSGLFVIMPMRLSNASS